MVGWSGWSGFLRLKLLFIGKWPTMGNIELNKIEIDLGSFIISLFFSGGDGPLSLEFDSPSRRFYFSVIGIIIMEMIKNRARRFVPIRTLQEDLLLFDRKLSGQYASKRPDQLFEKIRKAWRNANGLKDLCKGKHFKVLGRTRGKRFDEVGACEEYDCNDDECNVWSNLIDYDERTGKKWSYGFSIDKVGLQFEDVTIIFGEEKGEAAVQVHGLDLQEGVRV